MTKTIRRMICVSALIMILAYPFSVGAETSPLPRDAMTEAEVREFIQTYMECYQARDVNRFMDLFSKQSAENRVLPYADVRDRYQRWFGECLRFACQFTVSTVQTFGPSALVTGRYQIVQSLRNGKEKIVRGKIQWELVREAGFLKISELNFGRGLTDD